MSSPSRLITDFAERAAGRLEFAPLEYDGGRLLSWMHEFFDADQSQWVDRRTTGSWLVGVAEFAPRDEHGPLLAGVMSPSPALTRSLLAEFDALLDEARIAHQRATFSVRGLLSAPFGDMRTRSVRVQDGGVRVLVRSDDEGALRESLATLSGEPIGVTVRTLDARPTLLNDGQVIFPDSTSLTAVLRFMRLIEVATEPPVILE